MRVFAILSFAAFIGIAGLSALRADDAIGRLMQGQGSSPDEGPARSLPVAPPRPIPKNVEGPTIGSKPQGPLPIVMSARIGEHNDRTRLVIELSDPLNLRAFALANPDRVVIDMPEVSWRLGAPPRPSGFGPVKSYRYGLFRAGDSRMVIDLNSPVSVADLTGSSPNMDLCRRLLNG